MALQITPYQIPNLGQAPKPWTDYSSEGFYEGGRMIAAAGQNLGNKMSEGLGAMAQQNKLDAQNQMIAGVGDLLQKGNYADAARLAAQGGQPELALKLGMAGAEQQRQDSAMKELNSSMGDLGFGGGGGGGGQSASNGMSGGNTDATSLIAKFEGFRSTPYWDVNHHRVGFGSDTITTADGKVVEVQPGMSVTREDAQRDLTRRIGEFQSGIQKDIGAENWARLPEGAKSALTSVAYNYGAGWARKIPSLAAAARSGDTNAIAEAIASRSGDNNGVNSKRRMMEAQIAKSGGPAGSPEPYKVAGNNWTAPPINQTEGQSPQPQFTGQDTNSEVDRLTKIQDNMSRMMFSPAFANAPAQYQEALKSRMGMIKDRIASLGGGAAPEAQKNYQLAVKQGYTGTFMDYQKELKGGVNVTNNVGGNESEFLKKSAEHLAKNFATYADEGMAARQDRALIGRLGELQQVIGQTGGGTALQGYLANNFGIKVGDNVGEVEAFNAIVDKLTPSQRVPGSGATSDLEIRTFKNSLPSLMKTPEGNQLVMQTLSGMADYKEKLGDIAQRAMVGELSQKDAYAEMKALQNPLSGFGERINAKPGQNTNQQPMQAGGSPLDEARAAIAAGVPKGLVLQRLRQNKIDATGL